MTSQLEALKELVSARQELAFTRQNYFKYHTKSNGMKFALARKRYDKLKADYEKIYGKFMEMYYNGPSNIR